MFRVTVRASAAPGLAITAVWLMAAGEADLGVLFNSPRKNREGHYEFHGVPPGSYVLEAHAETAGPGPKRSSVARVPLVVDSDVRPVPITVNGGIEVTGRVTIDGSNRTGLSLTFTGEDGESEEARPGEDGRFALRLEPGRYNVSLDRDPSNLVVRSIHSEGIDVYREGLAVAEGARPMLEIVLAADGGKLDGVVLDREEKPAGSASVLLIAEPSLRARYDAFHECETDQYGRYHFENIRPGRYRLFAWEDAEPNAWFDPEFMKRFEEKGEEVAIRPGAHETSKAHLIPAEAR